MRKKHMIWTCKGLFLATLAGGLLLACAVRGANHSARLEERDYQVIIDRNPFGLRPPPPPPTNAVAVASPVDQLLLTGITSLGKPRAYFMTKARPGKKPDYYSLSIGEREGALEVLAIDTAAGLVRVRNAGKEAALTFADNGVKPPPARPVASNRSRTRVVRPGSAKPISVRAAPTSTRVRSVPTRQVRLPSTARLNSRGNVPKPKPRPHAAAQDVLIMELQKTANPHITYPPTPVPQ